LTLICLNVGLRADYLNVRMTGGVSDRHWLKAHRISGLTYLLTNADTKCPDMCHCQRTIKKPLTHSLSNPLCFYFTLLLQCLWVHMYVSKEVGARVFLI